MSTMYRTRTDSDNSFNIASLPCNVHKLCSSWDTLLYITEPSNTFAWELNDFLYKVTRCSGFVSFDKLEWYSEKQDEGVLKYVSAEKRKDVLPYLGNLLSRPACTTKAKEGR